MSRARGGPKNRAVTYLRWPAGARHPTEKDQIEAVREFARRRGLIIVREYRDGSENCSSAGGPVLG